MLVVTGIIFFLWLFANLIQLYYWLVVVLPLWQQKPPPGRGSDLAVSVLVCTNRLHDSFGRLLATLRSQDFQNYEVVIVNDGPVPEVSDLVAREQPSFQSLREVGGGPAYQAICWQKGCA